jgi:transcriptional regulator with XRE-family HTH domain
MLLHVDDLGRLIERVMSEKSWTMSTLARRSGLSVSTLGSWKNGDRATGSRGPSPALLRKFADGAGLTVAEVYEAAGRKVPAAIDDEGERRFLHMYRAISGEDRRVVEATMQAMMERQKSTS